MTVELVPMSAAYAEQWMTIAIREYAEDMVQAGAWPTETAMQQSAETFKRLLPDGVNTDKQHLFTIEAGGQTVGMIWFAVENRRPSDSYAWIYDFRIDEQHRRHGYGYQAMLAVEAKVRALGLNKIGLHVFGHNHAAQALYEKAGYGVTGISMAKQI
jgi:ribosomal protein S18 acetylase RimI-like enzyme